MYAIGFSERFAPRVTLSATLLDEHGTVLGKLCRAGNTVILQVSAYFTFASSVKVPPELEMVVLVALNDSESGADAAASVTTTLADVALPVLFVTSIAKV